MVKSMVEIGSDVSFPVFTGERVYMEKFHKEEGLPKHLSRWKDTVDAMLKNVDTDNPIFIMIDQRTVNAGGLHRRPRPHIDGYWMEGIQAHGGGSRSTHNYDPKPSGHSYNPDRHYIPDERPNGHRHRSHRFSNTADSIPMTVSEGWDYGQSSRWKNVENSTILTVPEAIILASDISASRGYIGDWSASIGDGGDMGHLDLTGMTSIDLLANKVYIGNVGFIHESIPVKDDCQRTLVRLNVKDWEPQHFHS